MLSDLTVILEAATRALRERTVASVGRTLEKGMQRAFRAQGKRFARAFERRFKGQWPAIAALRTAGALGEAARLREAIEDDLGPAFEQAELETLGVFAKPLQAAARTALAAGARVLLAELDLSISFSLRNPRAVAYLEAHGAELVKSINDTTRAYIKTVVANAVENGWSYTRTARAIIERYREFAVGRPQAHIDSRAHLIAVTESGQAYMSGQFIVVEDLAAQGLQMEKAWSTMGDDKVSEGCAENEAAGWIRYDQLFPSGHMHPLRFPGCRCDLLSRVKP